MTVRRYLHAVMAAFAGVVAQASASDVMRREIESFVKENPGRKRAPKRLRRRWKALRAATRYEKSHFVKGRDTTARWYRHPHSPLQPRFTAIARTTEGGRKYQRCRTRDQALQHKPYVIEHVNGFGQVTHRERLGA